MRWASPRCARLPRPPMSSPTPSCAWRARWALKATMISANRSARKSAGPGQFPGPGALAAGSLKGGELGALYADMVSSAISQYRGDFRRHRRRHPQGSGRGDLGRAPGVHARRRRQQLQRQQLHLPGLHRHGQFHAIPRPARPPPTIWPGPTARRADRDDLQALPPRGGRGRQHRPRTGRHGDRRIRQPGSPRHHRLGVRFVVSVDTPQFFPSSVSTIALCWKRCCPSSSPASGRSSSGWSSSTAAAMSSASTPEEPNVNDIAARPRPLARSPLLHRSGNLRPRAQRAAGAHLAIRRPCFPGGETRRLFHLRDRRREPVLHSRPRRRSAVSTMSASTARMSWSRAKATPGCVVCPYHAWTYELTGELRSGPNIKSVEGFDKREICLSRVRIENFHGFIFANLDPDARRWTSGFPACAANWRTSCRTSPA
jgi:hypothetical protein